MQFRRKIAATAAVILAASAFTLINAMPAAAYSCTTSGNTKYCTSGFSSSDWSGGIQYIKLVNPYGHAKYANVYVNGIGPYLSCIPATGRTYDRNTTSAALNAMYC